MPPPVLLSRGVDPLLGIFTGCLAYYLYETNPRTSLPADQHLAIPHSVEVGQVAAREKQQAGCSRKRRRNYFSEVKGG
ncbi:hypothetical protein F5141DRAFT_1027032 [Pisolithus sp. B1]|nr:hypothetical protein F5141DRAFT_1027032 [Pisolithus sp. B1]